MFKIENVLVKVKDIETHSHSSVVSQWFSSLMICGLVTILRKMQHIQLLASFVRNPNFPYSNPIKYIHCNHRKVQKVTSFLCCQKKILVKELFAGQMYFRESQVHHEVITRWLDCFEAWMSNRGKWVKIKSNLVNMVDKTNTGRKACGSLGDTKELFLT